LGEFSAGGSIAFNNPVGDSHDTSDQTEMPRNMMTDWLFWFTVGFVLAVLVMALFEIRRLRQIVVITEIVANLHERSGQRTRNEG